MNNINPLGRGLESLIPPQKQRADGNSQPAGDFGASPIFPMTIQPNQPTSPAEEAAKVFEVAETKTEPVKAFEADEQLRRPGGVGVPTGNSDSIVGGASGKEEHASFVSAPAAEPVRGEERTMRPAVSKVMPGKERKADEAIYYIEVSKVRPNPDQPRREFNEESLRELASSIREFGLLQPIVVSKIEKEVENGTEVEYELVAGERRLRASKLLGLEMIPAIIRNVRLERERLELAIIENIQRENLSPIEMARAYARLQDEFRLTQREVASRLGKSRETVANTLRLLDLPTEIQDAISKGQLTESHGRLLLTIDDQAVQNKLFLDLIANKISTRELKDQAAAYVKIKQEAKHEINLPPEIKLAEERLASELGAPVVIKDHDGAGKITISFYSKEELVNLLKRLGAQEDDSLSL